MTRSNPSFSNQRRWKSNPMKYFHCKGQLSKCAKGMRKTTLGDPSRGGLPGGLSWGAAPSLPTTHCPPPYPLSTTYPLPTVHHLTHCPLLTYYTLSTTCPLPLLIHSPLSTTCSTSEHFRKWILDSIHITLPIHTANSARVEIQKVLQYLVFAPQCKLCSPYF